MKKFLLIFAATLLISGIQAQVLFEETFNGGVIPVPGWTIMGNVSNFANPQTSNAGGTAPELQFDNDPVFPTTTMRIISPKINTTGVDRVIIRFKHMFDHVDGASASVNLAVDTRSSNGAWNNVWTKATTTDITAESVIIVVSNANVGSSSFQLSLSMNGNSQNMKNWFIDNVEVLNPLSLDGAMSSLDLPIVFVDKQPIKGNFSNLGTTPITSADVNWMIEDGDTHTTSYTGLNLALGASHDYLSADSLYVPAGVYELKVWLSNVNGVSSDDNLSNDTIYKHLEIPEHLNFYNPLFEEFTSSTCGYCPDLNNNIIAPFMAQHSEDEFTLIKYQVGWPGNGDPYCTAEVDARVAYYGVSGVPALYIDGKENNATTASVNASFNATAGQICYIGIESSHEIEGNNIIVNAKIIPAANYSNVKIHLVVLERETTQNVGTNGETHFEHVLMKMIPDASGTSADLVAGKSITISQTVDLSSTNVEEMDDLMLAIFVQESSKTILQSGYSVEVGASVSSSIQDGAINVPVSNPIIINFSQPVRMVGGEVITNENVASIISLVDSMNVNAGFIATINSAKTQITVTPNPALGYYKSYTLSILPVENSLSVPTLRYTTHFTTLLNVGVIDAPISEFSVYPNPANGTLNINDSRNIETIEIYSIIGNLVKTVKVHNMTGQFGINVSDLNTGLYFLKARGYQTEKTMRFVIAR